MFAQIRYHFDIPFPERLPDNEILKLHQDLRWIKDEERKERMAEQQK
jgi:hypothetical protein